MEEHTKFHLAKTTLGFAVLLFGPHLTIWALNAVFGLALPHNLTTWFAVLWLTLLIKTTRATTAEPELPAKKKII